MKKILFITNSEYGQANVILATAYELMIRGCEVHIASHETQSHMSGNSVPNRISDLNKRDSGITPSEIKPMVFHPIRTVSMMEGIARNGTVQTFGEFSHGTGVKEALCMYKKIFDILCPWEPAEYTEGVDSCVEIIKAVKPDLVVNDNLCNMAQDACTLVSRRFIILSPNSFREFVAPVQPHLFGLLRVPASASGFRFPVPWYQIPLNIFLNIAVATILHRLPELKAINAIRKKHGIETTFPLLVPYNKDSHYLIPATLECDYRFPYIPKNVTACGPILLPSTGLSEADPELEAWLALRPTILINLGSNFQYKTDITNDLATAIDVALEKNHGIQVLWKLKLVNDKDPQCNLLGNHSLQNERLRIEPWLKVEPSALLNSGLIVCSVHHGGANSYYEAVSNGVPQVILPLWSDTFEYADRVEYLRIGIHASRYTAPKLDPATVGQALATITDGNNEQGKEIVQRAKDLGSKMSHYRGRVAACEKILELSEIPEFKA